MNRKLIEILSLLCAFMPAWAFGTFETSTCPRSLVLGFPALSQIRSVFQYRGGRLIDAAISADGRTVAITDAKKRFGWIDTQSQQFHFPSSMEDKSPHLLEFSFDGRFLAAAIQNHGVTAWNIATEDEITVAEPMKWWNPLRLEPGNRICAIAFSREDSLAFSCAIGQVQLFHLRGRVPGERIPLMNENVPFDAKPGPGLALSPDGEQIAATHERVVVDDAGAGFNLSVPSTGFRVGGIVSNTFNDTSLHFGRDYQMRHFSGLIPGEFSGVAFSPDGKSIVTWRNAHRIKRTGAAKAEDVLPPDIQFWDLDTMLPTERRLDGHTRSIRKAVFDKSGKYLASFDTSNEVIVWNLNTQRAIQNVRLPQESPLLAIGFHPEKRTVRIINDDGTVFELVF